ncbi:MAG: MFS transporter [Chloroflexi bacterium]|nr:MFS transporter [Chloroflexota bacterium]
MPEKKSGFFYGYVIVIACFIVMVVSIGINYSFGVFFEPLLNEFGWTRATISGAYSLFLAIYGPLAIIGGRLNDKFGPRVLITISGLILGLGFLLLSLTSAVWQLYLFFGALMAMGLSIGFVPLLSTVARWFVKGRGLMNGIILSGTGAGSMLWPLVMNWIIAGYGWRTLFVVLGIVSIVVVAVAAQFLKRDPQSVGLSPYGGNAAVSTTPMPETGLSLREAVRTPQLWLLLAIVLTMGYTTFTALVHIVIHAIGLGIPTAVAGGALSFYGGMNIVGRIGMGVLADRIGTKRAYVIGLVLLALNMLWLLAVKNVWMLYLFTGVFGIAFGTFAITSPIMAEFFGLKSHGALMGISETAMVVGAAAGPVLTGYIYDVTGSYQLGFMINAVIAVIGLMLGLVVRPLRK